MYVNIHLQFLATNPLQYRKFPIAWIKWLSQFTFDTAEITHCSKYRRLHLNVSDTRSISILQILQFFFFIIQADGTIQPALS